MIWNQFDEHISEMVYRVSIGIDKPPFFSPKSYKQQAALELARRLHLENKLRELNQDYLKMIDRMELAESELSILKDEILQGANSESPR